MVCFTPQSSSIKNCYQISKHLQRLALIRIYSLPGRVNTMDQYLDTLDKKRGSARENALSSIIEGLMNNYKHKFATKNFATVLYRCLNSFKKGSLKESSLAARVLGLLAITIGFGDNALELYKEAHPPLSQALKPGSDSTKLISILDCLAIVTFVGGNESEHTERSMQIIWQFIHSGSNCNVLGKKHWAAVQTAAISAWSLLLSSIDYWALNYTYWQGAISFFLDLLESDEDSVCIAADEALTIILEGGYLEKFASVGRGACDSSFCEENNSLAEYKSIQELKEKMLNRARGISLQLKNISLADEPTDAKCNSTWKFMKLLEDGCNPETSMKIGKQHLKLYTYSQFLQVTFLKHFLGIGFVRHMLENEFLHEVFNFTPKKQPSGKELYVSEREEVTVSFFVPEARREDCEERINKSHNSVFRKARTQLLNKQRDIRGKELQSTLD